MTGDMFSLSKQEQACQRLCCWQEFPIYQDRMPLQLLAYTRLTRVQDPAQLALVGVSKARQAPCRGVRFMRLK